MYNSLVELSKKMNKQDNRSTAYPIVFRIKTDIDVVVPEGYGDRESYIIDSEEYSKEEAKESFFEDFEEQDEYTDFENYLEKELSAHLIESVTEHKYKGTFFTEDACENHIKSNKHHYRNPESYVDHAWRNPEMELVQNFLKQLSKQPNK